MPDVSEAAMLPSLGSALRVWARIGVLSFGGPAGQIAMLHREIVEERHWLGERRFLHALSFCALLPGPEAQQLATYLGWVMHGPLGGVAAGTLFVLPGAVVLLALSVLYATLGQVPAVDGLFFGLKCAVLALVVQALLRIARRALHGAPSWAVAAAAFVALNLFAVPFPAVVLAGLLLGYLLPDWFKPTRHGAAHGDAPGLIERVLAADPGRLARQARAARRAGLVAFGLWITPVAALAIFLPGTYADVAWFFSKMAVVTVGGAYAVLAYVAQDAVHAYHWVTPPEMLAGLGLAETTPGPLILVLQFVGFLAGYRAPGPLTGIPGGVAASVLTLWVTLPAVLHVRLSRRAAGRTIGGEPPPRRLAGRRYRHRGRRHRQPGAVVRAARAVQCHHDPPRGPGRAGTAAALQPATGGACAGRGGVTVAVLARPKRPAHLGGVRHGRAGAETAMTRTTPGVDMPGTCTAV
jgi:chromate transporter